MIEWLSVADTARMIASGELTAVKVVDHHLERIHSLDRDIKTYLTVDAEGARAQAAAIDARRAHGDASGQSPRRDRSTRRYSGG